MMRRFVLLTAGLALPVFAFVALVSHPAMAGGGVWGAFKGKILASDQAFGTDFPTDTAMISAFKKQSKSAIAGDGAWTLNLMVFLNQPPGAESINIVYYDVSVKPKDQVNFSEVAVQPDQKIVQLNGINVSKDLGFVKGHKYEVLATRVIGGKEKVYAKTTVTLK